MPATHEFFQFPKKFQKRQSQGKFYTIPYFHHFTSWPFYVVHNSSSHPTSKLFSSFPPSKNKILSFWHPCTWPWAQGRRRPARQGCTAASYQPACPADSARTSHWSHQQQNLQKRERKKENVGNAKLRNKEKSEICDWGGKWESFCMDWICCSPSPSLKCHSYMQFGNRQWWQRELIGGPSENPPR